MAVSDKCEKPSKDILSLAFMPKDTLDQPCDVILVVERGKQFKAHRQVLSEASPFFEKLLNSDMKESKEGVVRLEMFSESVMGNTLEFIYTGNVQILTEDNARDLIVMADYLFLQNLKSLAERVLLQSLNVSNCFSNYYLSERYRCEELFSKTQKFILANFSAAHAANRIEVLNMSSKEIEMFISSDEINVNAEEDVFNIILSWIDHDKSKRKKYFAELFRHVRLVYVSRDFLCKDIVTNDLVKDSEGSLDLVVDAVKLIESKDFSHLSVTPRKSLETSVIVMESRENILCYFPCEDKWCNLGSSYTSCHKFMTDFSRVFVCCRGNLYTLDQDPVGSLFYMRRLVRYNPFSNECMLLPYGNESNRYVYQIFVTKDDEMYALEADESVQRLGCRYGFFITKYKPESNSWEDILSFNLGRRSFCIVAKDDFIYFIGGAESDRNEFGLVTNLLTDVDRYDIRKDQWNKVADTQSCRYHLGAAVNEKICVAGIELWSETNHCEVYDETTNEWQIIASPKGRLAKLLTVDDRLYVVCGVMKHTDGFKVECYDSVNDEWNLKNELAVPQHAFTGKVCSMRIYKGFLSDHQLESLFPGSLLKPSTTRSSSLRSSGKWKCLVM
ncbi:hypothetical protein ACROYT_G036239 [Oculina patagonica]